MHWLKWLLTWIVIDHVLCEYCIIIEQQSFVKKKEKKTISIPSILLKINKTNNNQKEKKKSSIVQLEYHYLFFYKRKLNYEFKLDKTVSLTSSAKIMRSSWAPPDVYKNKVEFGSFHNCQGSSF